MTRKEVKKSEVITVSTAAVTLTAANMLPPINKVFVHFEGPVRYWRSGLAPTASTGIPLDDKATKEFDISEATGLKMIRNGGADAKAHVEYIYERET